METHLEVRPLICSVAPRTARDALGIKANCTSSRSMKREKVGGVYVSVSIWA